MSPVSGADDIALGVVCFFQALVKLRSVPPVSVRLAAVAPKISASDCSFDYSGGERALPFSLSVPKLYHGKQELSTPPSFVKNNAAAARFAQFPKILRKFY